jgi:cytochrome c
VVPDDFTLSDRTIAQAQARLPNRNGMSQAHAMWPGQELGGVRQPDVKAVACMSNCAVEAKVASLLPDHARNAHGNLAEQNRAVGAQHGADTTRPEGKTAATAVARSAEPKPIAPQAAVKPADGKTMDAKAAVALANKYTCTACHGLSQKLVGPAFSDVARKHAGQTAYLQEKIIKGSSGVWGPIPMPPQSLPAADARLLAEWLAAGAPPK